MIKLGLNEPVAAQADAPEAETLQFRKVEMEQAGTRRCAACGQAFAGDYYQVAGADTCPACAQQRLAAQQNRGGWAEYGRAALFGFGAAIAGAGLFAIVAIAIHVRFGLLAIVVGMMVGKAVLMGSRGLRGRRYQILAVLLTYFAITTSYLPEILKGFSQAQAKIEAQQKANGTVVPVKPAVQITAATLVIALVFVLAMALIAPFLLLTHGTGFIGLIIIGIGLMQAWKLTAADDAAVTGPYGA